MLEGYAFSVYSTKECPENQAEWKNRSSAINCTESNGYMCLPNENFTDLLEFCYLYPRILVQKGMNIDIYTLVGNLVQIKYAFCLHSSI